MQPINNTTQNTISKTEISTIELIGLGASQKEALMKALVKTQDTLLKSNPNLILRTTIKEIRLISIEKVEHSKKVFLVLKKKQNLIQIKISADIEVVYIDPNALTPSLK